MNKLKVNELKKTAKELIELLQPEDPINIKTAGEKELIEVIKEGIDELEEGELEELSEVAQKVIKVLSKESEKPKKSTSNKSKKVEEETEEEEEEETEEEDEEGEGEDEDEEGEDEDEEEDDSLEGLVNSIKSLDQLKSLIKEDEIFKGIRKGLALQKDLGKLKIRALKCIKGEELPKPKSSKVPVSKAAKPKKEKVEKPKKEKAVSAYNFIQVAVCKNFDISTQDIIDGLAEIGITTSSERYVDSRRKEALSVINILKDLNKVK